MSARIGEKIHVAVRRRFEQDLRRHFIGEVIDSGDSCMRLKGYAFTFDSGKNLFARHPELRTRIISLVDAVNIINILPETAEIDQAHYAMSKEGRMVVTDGKNFWLDVHEFGAAR
jgi:hypothetical protein